MGVQGGGGGGVEVVGQKGGRGGASRAAGEWGWTRESLVRSSRRERKLVPTKERGGNDENSELEGLEPRRIQVGGVR